MIIDKSSFYECNAIRLLLFLLSSIVSRFILYTNLHVEIIVNHMFYEHQSCLFIVRKKYSLHTFRSSFHFISFFCVFPMFKSMIMCYFITEFWPFQNSKWSLNYLLYYLYSIMNAFGRESYLFSIAFVCVYVCAKWKQFQFDVFFLFLIRLISKLNYISNFVGCIYIVEQRYVYRIGILPIHAPTLNLMWLTWVYQPMYQLVIALPFCSFRSLSHSLVSKIFGIFCYI